MHRMVAALLSCAMLLSLLVPSGFMPDHSDGSFSIKLCSGIQDAKLVIDRNNPQYELLALVNGINTQTDTDRGSDTEEMQDCAFSAGAGLALTPPPTVATEIVRHPAFVSAIPRVRQYSGHALRLPPSTGPPIHS